MTKVMKKSKRPLIRPYVSEKDFLGNALYTNQKVTVIHQ